MRQDQRRHRSESCARGRAVRVSHRDLRLLSALDRHGPLPTHLAFEVWRGVEPRSLEPFKDRLVTLFHEHLDEGPLLERPRELNPRNVPSEPQWLDLAASGRRLLAEKGLVARHGAPKRDPLRHRAMGACIAASFEVLAARRGLRFWDREAIFARPGRPVSLRPGTNSLRLQTSVGGLEPDDLMGLEYLGRGYSFFAREDDRGTETFRRPAGRQSSLEGKIQRYIEVLSNQAYRDQWRIPNLRVLIATTQPGRIDTMLRHLRKHPRGDSFLFKAFPTFGVDWRAPRGILENVFAPWESIA